MKIVLDTNVFISGVFFGGPPFEVLRAWRDGKVQFLLSPEILEEYRSVGNEIARRFVGVELAPVLDLLAVHAAICLAPKLPHEVCDDPDDDKFLACALAGKADLIVSGDKHLLRASGYQGIMVLRPREFVRRYLEEPSSA